MNSFHTCQTRLLKYQLHILNHNALKHEEKDDYNWGLSLVAYGQTKSAT